MAQRREEIEQAKKNMEQERSALIARRREDQLTIQVCVTFWAFFGPFPNNDSNEPRAATNICALEQARVLREAEAARIAEIQKFEKEADSEIYEAEDLEKSKCLKGRQENCYRSHQRQLDIRRQAKEMEKQEEDEFIRCWKIHDQRIKVCALTSLTKIYKG